MSDESDIGVWRETARYRSSDGLVHASFIMLLDVIENNARFKVCSALRDAEAGVLTKETPITCFQCLNNLGG